MKLDLATFLFELVNFLVLAALLERLIYRPLRRGIDERRAAIDRQVRDAEATKREAEELKRTWHEKLGEHERLRREAMREAAEDAARERARLVAEARDDAAAERARGQRGLEAEREAELAWAREVAIEASATLAGRLVQELAPAAVDGALVDLLARELEREPPRRNGREAVVAFARSPEEGARERLRAAVERAAPGSTVVWSEDPSLLAGALVRVGHRVLDASLKGQVAALRDRARHLLEMEGGDLERGA